MQLLNAFTAYGVYASVMDISNDISGLMPLWGWIFLLIIGLLFAPVFPFHKMRVKVKEFEEAQPNIVFGQFVESPLHRSLRNNEGVLLRTDPIYHINQIWFRNNPIKRLDSSIAKQLTANIEVWDWDNACMRCEVYGQWVTKPVAPTFAEFQPKETNHIIDISPNNENYRLNIALKWAEESSGFAYAKESFIHSQYQDGRDEGRKIPKGIHPVIIRLRGVGVDKDFFFILSNPGEGGVLTMKDMPKTKKDAQKEEHRINKKDLHKILNKASQPIKKSEKEKS